MNQPTPENYIPVVEIFLDPSPTTEKVVRFGLHPQGHAPMKLALSSTDAKKFFSHLLRVGVAQW